MAVEIKNGVILPYELVKFTSDLLSDLEDYIIEDNLHNMHEKYREVLLSIRANLQDLAQYTIVHGMPESTYMKRMFENLKKDIENEILLEKKEQGCCNWCSKPVGSSVEKTYGSDLKCCAGCKAKGLDKTPVVYGGKERANIEEVKRKKKWMQKLDIKEEALTKQAEREGGLNPDGTISVKWMKEKLADPDTRARTRKRINLALNFKKANESRIRNTDKKLLEEDIVAHTTLRDALEAEAEELFPNPDEETAMDFAWGFWDEQMGEGASGVTEKDVNEVASKWMDKAWSKVMANRETWIKSELRKRGIMESKLVKEGYYFKKTGRPAIMPHRNPNEKYYLLDAPNSEWGFIVRHEDPQNKSIFSFNKSKELIDYINQTIFDGNNPDDSLAVARDLVDEYHKFVGPVIFKYDK